MLVEPPTSPFFWFLVCWLAVWRLTMLLCYEAGPFDIFSLIRVGFARLGLFRVIACFHCMSLWISVPVVLVVFKLHAYSILVVLGVAGAASLTERFFERETGQSGEQDG